MPQTAGANMPLRARKLTRARYAILSAPPYGVTSQDLRRSVSPSRVITPFKKEKKSMGFDRVSFT
eukprot:1159311-Pelagomonas_calceolata.AAC.1